LGERGVDGDDVRIGIADRASGIISRRGFEMTLGVTESAALGEGIGAAGACCASALGANAATPAAVPIVRIAVRRESGPRPS
jgi:hypothetical protein